MTAFRIGSELNLVHREKLDVHVERHGFGGADEVTGPFGHDAFLAGDESGRTLALAGDDAIVDFPGQQPQRQADHAAAVCKHAFDGEVCLARVGRTENGRKAHFGTRHGGTFTVKRIGCKGSLSPLAAPCARVYVNGVASLTWERDHESLHRHQWRRPAGAMIHHHGQGTVYGCAGHSRVLS